MSAKVSICIPTYNRKDFLKETLDSVFAQTYQDFEVVIVDDGSTDGTEQMIKDAGYPLRYYWQENKGEVVTRNKLIELAQGRYISFIDSDDILMPDAIERMIVFANRESEDVIVYGSYLRIDQYGNICGRSKRKLYSGYITKHLFQDIFVSLNGSMFPKKVFQEVGNFDTSLKVCTDYNWELRASLKYRFIALREPTFKHRRHSGNVSERSFDNRKMELDLLEDFYYNGGGKEVILRGRAMKRLSKEGYRAGRCAIKEGLKETACQLLRQSFRRHPNLKSLLWLIIAAAK
ncbi:MAG: glycosyltransferase family 2 protein [Planctomycetota bacterium]|jgi:glycosyltransferase involved in cell wall biosynthesis